LIAVAVSRIRWYTFSY